MRYFTEDEFMMDGAPVFDKMDAWFLEILDDARDFAEVPFNIVSSYRSPEYNEKVGGVPDSAHTKGVAVDVSYSNGNEAWHIIDGAFMAGIKRIGIAGGFIHLDDDRTKPYPCIWTYEKQPI